MTRLHWVCLMGALCGFLMGAESWMAPQTPNIRASDFGLEGLRAEDCGRCHTAIYDEWKQSTHAAAWVDPQFQAELHKDPDVAWMCLNCHTPVGNQQAEVVTQSEVIRRPATRLNTEFSTAYREEGVSCLGCHWRKDGIAAPHRDVDAPHAVVYAPDLLNDSACTDCHQAMARLEDALVCHFDTGGEKERAGVQKSCSACHMPSVERPVVGGGKSRKGGAHTWPGSGLGKGLWPGPLGLNSLAVHMPMLDASGRLSFTLHNAKAGHKLPTGDPERFIRITAETRDAKGRIVEEHTWRIGQVWVWSPVAKQLSDNRLDVDERRQFEWVPSRPASSVSLTIEHVRMSQDNLDYHIGLVAKGHPGPEIERLRRYPTSRVLFQRELTPPTR